MFSLTQSGLTFRRLELPQLSRHLPCNPSVMVQNGKLMACYRGVNYDLREGYRFWYGSVGSQITDSQNYLATIAPNLSQASSRFIEDRHIRRHPLALNGLQDLRLFEWKGETYALGSAAVSEPTGQLNEHRLRNTSFLCKLKGGHLELVNFFQTARLNEKNWMPWVVDERLFVVYEPDPFTVLEFADKKMQLVISPAQKLKLPKQTGSSCVITLGDYYLGVVHDKVGLGRKAVYSHTLVQFSRNFEVLRVSTPFTFEGETVEFCAGLAILDDNLIFSYGVWDQKAVILSLNLKACLQLLFQD